MKSFSAKIRQAAIHGLGLLCAGIVLLAWTADPSQAQTTMGTSTVTGVVYDSSQAAVPHAHVTLLDRLHGTQRETTANEQGEYLFTAVLPGLYSLQVDASGFQTTTVNNVKVVIDQTASVNATLSSTPPPTRTPVGVERSFHTDSRVAVN